MAFQFQSVAAVSPLIADSYAVGLAEIGLLIGLYLAPGVIIAIPGGAIAARFGEKRVVGLSIILMLIGAVLTTLAPSWGLLVFARVLAGAGGVVLNVVMTKMLVDWFVGREISTAMAIFVNSWPVGIALALLILPVLALHGGLAIAWACVIVVILAGLALFSIAYLAPQDAAAAQSTIVIGKFPIYGLSLAGVIWAFYNAALAMVFSFGPTLLNQQGWSVAAAGSATSAFMIAFSLAVPLGGILSDRTGRRDTIITVSLLSFVVLMPLSLYASPAFVTAILVIVGALFALAAGPIMTLPSVVLPPESRTFGMGVFFTIYYVVMMVAPRVAGGLADATGTAGIAIVLGAAMSVACVLALVLFRGASPRTDPISSA